MRSFLLTAASALALAAPSLAQSAPPASGVPVVTDDQEIVVTGSRLKRRVSDSVEPTLIVDAKQIETRGYTNVGDALRELPEFGPGINGQGAQSGFGPGQTFADFFSLGSQRTLVLIDGSRVVPNNSASTFGPTGAGGSQVDLNTIPVNLIDRIDTIAIGGAPIYGSDAVAGTINFILKKNFQGFQIQGENSISGFGDAGNYRISALAGHNFAGGRGNITISGEYDRTEGLIGTDRPSIASDLFFTTPSQRGTFKQQLYSNLRFPTLSDNGTPFVLDGFAVDPTRVAAFGQSSVVDGNGNALRFSPGGSLIPIDFGGRTGSFLRSSGGNGLDLATRSNLLTPSDRYLGTILTNYQFSDHLKGFAQGWFSESDTLNLVDQGYYNTALFNGAGQINGNLIIPITNPFLSPAARATIQSNLDSNIAAKNIPASQNFFYLGRTNDDIEPSTASGDQTTYRIVAGLTGDFGVIGHDLTWGVTGTYGKNRQVNRSPQVVTQNFYNALNATTDAAGNIVCAPGYTNAAIATLSANCAPLNPFGFGSPSKASINYLTAIAKSVSENELADVVAHVDDNNLIKLPGGEAGFSIGYEHRDERARFDPGTFYRGQSNGDGTFTQFGNSIPIPPVSGGYHTNEGFAELNLPFVSKSTGLRFIDTFDVKAAARYIQNSIAGGAWTYTGGGRLGFVPDFTFRGNFTRSIRSPAVTELFAPVGQAFFTANDPCDSQFIGGGPNAANRARNCAAAGIVQPFSSNIVNFTQPGTQGGNPNLKNEVADSWTAGVQIRPRMIPRLAINVDWINIDLKQAIVSLSALDVLNACYDASSYPSAICSNITRSVSADPNANGQISFIRTGNLNAAEYKVAGLTVSANYFVPTPFIGATGKLSFNGNYFYTDTNEYRVGTGDRNIQSGSIGYNRHTATVDANYDSDTIGFQLQARYFSSASFNANDAINQKNIPTVPDVVFLNSTLSLLVGKQYTFRLSVDNLLDQGSPYPATAADTTVYFAGILGRIYRVSAQVRF